MTSEDPVSAVAAALAEHYRIERELGHGGMATVYLAHDLRHGRPVAVKVLRPDLAASLGRDRFLREIQLAAHLQHPGILPLHDSGSSGDFLYYIMPYVEGESLRSRLARERELPVQEVVRLLSEVLDALSYAHEKGVVHRDIKPDNVLLTSGHAVVTDFGVAKAVDTAADRGFVTTAGMAVGTPSYMAPEQAVADREIDHRADLYAVGVMGYELLAGRPPFVGSTPQQVMAAQLTRKPESLQSLRAAVPPALAGVIMRALEKRPADRWQSARAMLGQLQPFQSPAAADSTMSVPASPPRATSARRLWPFVAGTLLLATGGVAAFLALRSRRPPEPQLGRRVQVTLDPGLEIDPALSPDGRFLAYSAGRSADLEVRVRQVDGGSAITPASGLGKPQRFPLWSPDGRQIMFRSPRGIEIVPALGGASRLLAANQPAAERAGRMDVWGSGTLLMPAGWSPDGKSIAFLRADSLYTVKLDGGDSRLLTRGGEMHSFAWSPDGRWIACVRGNRQSQQTGFFFGNRGQSGIWVLPAAGGPAVAVTDDRSYHASPAWMPGSRALLFVSDRDGGLDVYHQSIDRSGKAEGAPRRLTTGLNAVGISLAANGSRLAYAVFSETSNVWSLPVPTGEARSIRGAEPVTTGSQVIEGFDISPDGEWIAFDSDRGGTQEIYRLPLSGGEPERLTEDPIDDFWPRWSPDGKEISFHAFREARRHLFLMAADGSGRQQLTSGSHDERAASWSPDGRALFYLQDYNAPGSEVRSLPRTGGKWGPPRTVFRGDALPVDVSPDGREIAFASGGAVLDVSAAGDSTRALVPASSNGPVPTYVSWSDDGRTVYYLAVDGAGTASIWKVARSGGTPRLQVRFDDPTREWHRFGFAQSHNRFYITLGDRRSDVWVTEVTSGNR